MENIHSTIAWYQKKIGSYDRQLWEQSVERKLQKGLPNAHHAPRKTVKLKTEYIDVDLIRGSTFTRTKPQVPWIYITKKAIVRVLFFPFYYRWWAVQTSQRVFGGLLVLYLLQVVTALIYFWNLDGTIIEDELTLTEVVVPIGLMFILGLIHSQTVLAHFSLKPPRRDNRHGRKSKKRGRLSRDVSGEHSGSGNPDSASDGGGRTPRSHRHTASLWNIPRVEVSGTEPAASHSSTSAPSSSRRSSLQTHPRRAPKVSGKKNVRICDALHECDSTTKAQGPEKGRQTGHACRESETLSLAQCDNEETAEAQHSVVVNGAVDCSAEKGQVRKVDVVCGVVGGAQGGSHESRIDADRSSSGFEDGCESSAAYEGDSFPGYGAAEFDSLLARKPAEHRKVRDLLSQDSTPLYPQKHAKSYQTGKGFEGMAALEYTPPQPETFPHSQELMQSRSLTNSNIDLGCCSELKHDGERPQEGQFDKVGKSFLDQELSPCCDKWLTSETASQVPSALFLTHDLELCNSDIQASLSLSALPIGEIHPKTLSDLTTSMIPPSDSKSPCPIQQEIGSVIVVSNCQDSPETPKSEAALETPKTEAISETPKTLALSETALVRDPHNSSPHRSSFSEDGAADQRDEDNFSDTGHVSNSSNYNPSDSESDEEEEVNPVQSSDAGMVPPKENPSPQLSASPRKMAQLSPEGESSNSDPGSPEARQSSGVRRRRRASCNQPAGEEGGSGGARGTRPLPPKLLNLRGQSQSRVTQTSGVSSSETEAGGLTPESANKATMSSEEWEDRMQSDVTTSSSYSSSNSESELSENEENIEVQNPDEEDCLPSSQFHDINLMQPPTSTNPSNVGAQPDKVSCVIWEGNECKKLDLTALDIGWAIIDKVDNLPESSDYIFIGLFLSLCLGCVPLIFRFYTARLLPSDLSPQVLSWLWDVFCKNSWGQNLVIFNGYVQRLSLSCIFFFLLTVTDRTFKQRLLYAKHFSYLTSSRRARKFDMPHFRLNKVRNIKIWLSLRSYLKRRGPQRSVDVIVSASFYMTISLVCLMCIQMLKDSETYLDFLCNWELVMWCLALGVYIMRFMTLGLKINKKYRNLSVLITEQINLYLQMEQKPHKKEELTLANNVLRLAEDLLKELESPFKISGFSANPLIYNITKVVVLSAFSAVMTELLGFKLKLYKIKLK